jgi:hypothetical protein
MEKISTLNGILIILCAAAILFGGAFYFQYMTMQELRASVIQQINPSAGWKTYTNNKYGFELNFPDSWKGYSVVEQSWEGHAIDNYQQAYSGPLVIIKNPQTISTQQWQDIPIMVFTPDQWQLILQERLSVSAAPIGPAEVGQNTKYVFATPPRWYGFADAIGSQEAVDAVKTFKAF